MFMKTIGLNLAEILTELRARVGERNYHAFFEGIDMRLEENDSVSVSVPTRTGRDALERCYSREILSALRLFHPQVATVQFFQASKPSTPTSTTLAIVTDKLLAAAKPANDPLMRRGGDSLSSGSAMRMTTRLESELPLKSEFRLSVFQSGQCNRMAYSAAQTIVESPGTVFNLVYIHGGTGLGKTHLLHGIGWALREANPKLRIVYTNSETIANTFITALHSSCVDAFRMLFRSADVLLVDDIQFLIGKIKTEQELIATIQMLRNAGKQLVCSGSMDLCELAKVDSRLADLLRSGLVERIDAPDFELRVKMLHRLAERRNWKLSDEVARVLATHIEKNIAHLDGAVLKLLALSRGYGCDPNEKLALEALREIGYLRKSDVLTLPEILDEVAKHYGVKSAEMCTDKRNAEVVRARYMALYLSKNLTSHTVAQLARFYGNRDHTSVLYALRKMNGDVKRDEPLKADIQRLKQALGR